MVYNLLYCAIHVQHLFIDNDLSMLRADNYIQRILLCVRNQAAAFTAKVPT